MSTNIFLDSAYKAVDASYKANEAGQYAKSWAKTVPARGYFLLDTITNIAKSAIYTVGAACGAVQAIFTWGKKTSLLENNSEGLDKSLNRVVFGAVGTVAPSASRPLEHEFGGSGLKIVGRATILAGIFYLAYKMPKPDRMYYNDTHGFTYGWEL